MSDWLDLLAKDAVLVTGGNRLARDYRLRYGRERREQGLEAWPSPSILSWNAWLDSLWNTLLVSAPQAPPLLLGGRREQIVWESIIRSSPDAARLLRPKDAAATAAEAWLLVRQYRLPFRREEFVEREDTEVYFEWAEAFERRLRSENWLDTASLPDFLAASLERGEWRAPPSLLLAGFEEYTPQQNEFLATLRRHGCRVEETVAGVAGRGRVRRLRCRDAAEELAAAAAWSRVVLERHPASQVLVVVPDLSSRLAETEHAFLEALHPGALADGRIQGERAFHISLGRPLGEVPLIGAALRLLRLAAEKLPLAEAGSLLRSPFLAGAQREFASRAGLDVKLRDDGALDVPIGHLLRRAMETGAPWHCPELAGRLLEVERFLAEIPRTLAPSAWCTRFSRLLQLAGWPGNGTLDSPQYQAIESWHETLSAFASLGAVSGPVTFEAALERLEEIVGETVFQPEDEGPPVQIAGLLEASGLEADFVWVMGLSDEVWPAPASPNPFLPLRLQRAHALPHSSPAREFEFARRITDRLFAAAPEVIASYPAQEDDRALRPSPFLAQLPEYDRESLEIPATETWGHPARRPPALESLVDERAPALREGSRAAGGTRLFQFQAACPFRAFAETRLGAEPFPTPGFGIDPPMRGRLMHRSLESLWANLKTKAALESLAEDELRNLAAGVVRSALNDTLPATVSPALRAIEQDRLEALVLAWVEVEKARPGAFSVEQRERERDVTLGGVTVTTYIDRVDRLEDGRALILDYKSTAPSPAAWGGPRPDEPQVPLYAASETAPLAGVAFAQLKAGELRFAGLTAGDGILPGVRGCPPEAPLDHQVGEWREALRRLAEDYREGHAEVDPKRHNTCDRCHLQALCRISDAARPAEGAEEAANGE